MKLEHAIIRDGELRRYRQASGIGLYLCRRICDNLGVKLAARSVPEQGTTVTIGLDQHRIEG